MRPLLTWNRQNRYWGSDDLSRYYDPALARFTQPDTLVPNPGDPQSLNRYSYAGNNPVRYTDPSGHKFVEVKSGHQGCNTGAPIADCVYPKGHKYAGYVISPLSPPTGVGIGVNATISVNTPVVQLHGGIGEEYVYNFSNKESTLFIVSSLGGSLGPNSSFRTHTLTAAIGQKGVILGTSYSPEEEGVPRTSKRRPLSDMIGTAIGYALTSDYSSSYYIPIFTQDETTNRFTYHISTTMDHLQSAMSFFWNGG